MVATNPPSITGKRDLSLVGTIGTSISSAFAA